MKLFAYQCSDVLALWRGPGGEGRWDGDVGFVEIGKVKEESGAGALMHEPEGGIQCQGRNDAERHSIQDGVRLVERNIDRVVGTLRDAFETGNPVLSGHCLISEFDSAALKPAQSVHGELIRQFVRWVPSRVHRSRDSNPACLIGP